MLNKLWLGKNMLRLMAIAGVSSAMSLTWLPGGTAGYQASKNLASDRIWIEAGEDRMLPAEMNVSNSYGKLGILNTSGPIRTKDHPFFEPLGLNPRGCVTCHQPADGMSLSVESLRERWRVTKGEDSVFAAVDGSNNPKLAQGLESSHTLLLNRGLFRIGLPWPPAESKGKPEFTIEVVRDPTGVNLDLTYGLTGVNPTVSVFRRPRPVANLKSLMSADSEADKPAKMILMADGRHPTLQRQAFNAYKDHQEGRQGQLPPEEMQKILAFENQIYVAQSFDKWGGSLAEPGGISGLGPLAIANGNIQFLANDSRETVWQLFGNWKTPETRPKELTAAQREFRASAARGYSIFMRRQFWIRGVAYINSAGAGNSIKQTCSACHTAPRWADVGTTNYQTKTLPAVSGDRAELPVFKCTCDSSAPPHPFLGRVIYTNDPGRALITGKCADIGSIVSGPLRGLAARAPYFSNGSARTFRELIDFHDRRFEMNLTEQERQDLENFLSVL